MNKIWQILNLPRSLAALWLFYKTPCREAICEDLVCRKQIPGFWSFHAAMLEDPLFRKVVYARTIRYNPSVTRFSKLFYRGAQNMELSADQIGGGVRIFHGHSTVVFARSIGRNFSVYQQVTIGRGKRINGNDIPIIGNNVTVYAGAIIVGGVHIGDHAVIGAGAVVTKDVPAHTTVVGAPVRYLRNES